MFNKLWFINTCQFLQDFGLAFVIAFGLLKFGIDVGTWGEAPRFADWTSGDRALFLLAWMIFTIVWLFVLRSGRK